MVRYLKRKYEPPTVDGKLKVTKGPIGFWRRTCTACGFSTVNGVPENGSAPDHNYGDGEYLSPPSEAETEQYQSLEMHYGAGEKVEWDYGQRFEEGELLNGKTLIGHTNICPNCDAELLYRNGIPREVPTRWAIYNTVRNALVG